MLLFWQWRPISAVVWHIADPQLARAVTAMSFAGWLMVLSSTFLINHFELFDLHQVANNLGGQPLPVPRFRTPLVYKFVRHPLYLGFIIAFWAAQDEQSRFAGASRGWPRRGKARGAE